jgi:hypothetical protein
MAKCGYCNSTIIVGGVRAGDQRFCNDKCYQNAQVLSVAKNIPPEVLEQQVQAAWSGSCPKCQGRGPVDVHKFHQVWSILVMTQWSSKSQVSCRSCGVKRQLGGIAFSLFCGWWGFPWGLILTPVQIIRNIVGMSSGPNSTRPSAELRRLVLINLAVQAQRVDNQRLASRPGYQSTAFRNGG